MTRGGGLFIIIQQKNLESDSFILTTYSNNLASSSFIKTIDNTNSITSDSHIVEVVSKNLTSDSFIKTTYENSLTSDSFITTTYTENLTSDSFIKNIGNTKNLASDMQIGWLGVEQNIVSDSFIVATYTKNLTSDSYIKKLANENNITSDSFIKKVDNENSLTSDSHIVETLSKSFSSDSFILATYSNSIISSSYIKKLGYEDSITSNSFIKKIDNTNSLTSDSHILKIIENSLTSDIFIKQTYNIGEYPVYDSLACWRMDDNADTTTVVDSAGGHNGTFSDATGDSNTSAHSTEGKDCRALTFDGVNDFVKTDDVIVSNPNALTISSWFKKESGGHTYECVLHHGSTTTIGSSSYWLGVDNVDSLTATIGANTGVGWAAGNTGVTAVYGEWYLLTATWDGSVVKVYINGVYNKQYNLTTYTNLLTPTRIGASADGTNYQF